MHPITPPTALLLSDELMFTSRITGTAHELGLAMKALRTQQQLEEAAREQSPACVVVDLANPGFDVSALIKNLSESDSPAPYVVAYGSHVDVATLKAARDAGCDLVLPRSKFVEDLPRELPNWYEKRSD